MSEPDHVLLALATLVFISFIPPQVHPASPPDESYFDFTYNATDFTPEQDYDYIIVGGGTAGCPLATTLSEKYSVLLLERGGVAGSDPNILYEINSLANIIGANEKDSAAQAFTSEDGIPNNRGNILGGTSMVNFGFYSRADDYFYNKSGIKWDMRRVKEAYEWVEDSVVTIPEGLNSWQNSTYHALLEAGVGPSNGFTLDHLIGTKISGSTFDGSGRRHGSVEHLNKAHHENLKVVVHATVDQILFSTGQTSVADGVVYHDSKGRYHKVHVRRKGEVILSAGAIGSPQLLLVSGVGPRSYLLSQNITIIHHHPYVGQYMVDNPRTGITLLVPFSLADIGLRVAGITNNGTIIESLSGVAPLYSPTSFLLFPYPSSPLNLSVVSIVAKFSRPLSVGSLGLKSPHNITVTPKLWFNYYSNSEDLLQCANIVRILAKMLETEAMEVYKSVNKDGGKYFKFIGFPLPEDPSNKESVERFCRETLRTYWHYHGGCLVNKVVDSDLKVVGIGGLRVIDGSVFSDAPGTNPQATVMMLGRYMGIKILKTRG